MITVAFLQNQWFKDPERAKRILEKFYTGESMPGTTLTHRLIIPDWHPARLNSWDGRHWAKRARLKKQDAELIAAYAHQQEIPKAIGKRRVSLVLTLGKGQRGADPDAYWKSCLDGCVHAGLLVDDSRKWVELGEVAYVRGLFGVRQTEIVLEDV